MLKSGFRSKNVYSSPRGLMSECDVIKWFLELLRVGYSAVLHDNAAHHFLRIFVIHKRIVCHGYCKCENPMLHSIYANGGDNP